MNEISFNKNVFIKSYKLNNTSPGSNELLAGDYDAGFYGEVEQNGFITYDELSRRFNINNGSLGSSSSPWLKFSLDNKILFISKTATRTQLSWNELDDYGVTQGNNTITVNGLEYKVRLMKGAEADPTQEVRDGYLGDAPDSFSVSEWNRLLYPIHESDPNNQNWGINYSSSDIMVDNKSTWCKELYGDDIQRHVTRGRGGLITWNGATSSNGENSVVIRVWRPVLELINY